MRPCTPINHRTPPRESAVKPVPHLAAPVRNPSQTRRHHLSSTPVQQLCTYVQSCDQKRFFSLDRAIAQPLAALPLTDAAYPLRVRPVFFSARPKRKWGVHCPAGNPAASPSIRTAPPQCPEVAFNPTIPVSSSTTNSIRSAVTGSLNRTIPTITAPTAPIPVHTA